MKLWRDCGHGWIESGGYIHNPTSEPIECAGPQEVEATPIPWCVEHDSPIFEKGRCDWVYGLSNENACRLEDQAVYRIKGTVDDA